MRAVGSIQCLARFERHGPDHNLVVESRKSCSNERTHPENPMVIPTEVFVEDDRSTKTPSRVDTGSGDGNSSQVNQEHSEPNWQWCQKWNVRISCVALGIGGREDGVDKNKGTNNLSAKTVAFGVTRGDEVGTAIVAAVEGFALEALNNSSTANCSKALHYHIEYCPRQRQLPRQEQTECHCRVNVTTRNASGAVNKGKDHATKGPSNSLNTNSGALGRRPIHSHNRQDCDI